MTINDDRQSKSNNMAELQFAAFDDALSEELASIGITNPISAAPIARPELLGMMKAASEDIKENHTRYNKNKRDWQEVDQHRASEGKEEYNAKRRGEYAELVMETERRTIRPYGVPDSPQKQASRNEQQKQSKRNKLAELFEGMTEAERTAYRTEQNVMRKARRDRAAATKI